MALDDGLNDLRRDYPRYHFWAGVTGLLYARRLRTSPSVALRSQVVENLREQVEAEVAYREHRWG